MEIQTISVINATCESCHGPLGQVEAVISLDEWGYSYINLDGFLCKRCSGPVRNRWPEGHGTWTPAAGFLDLREPDDIDNNVEDHLHSLEAEDYDEAEYDFLDIVDECSCPQWPKATAQDNESDFERLLFAHSQAV